MKTSLGLKQFVALMAVTLVSGRRVPIPPTRYRNNRPAYPDYKIEHPPVLTRPPRPVTQASQQVTAAPANVVPSTTPEPPEPADDFHTNQPGGSSTYGWGYDIFGNPMHDYFNNYNTATNSYDYNNNFNNYNNFNSFGGGVSAGAASAEVEYRTTAPSAPRRPPAAQMSPTRTRSSRRRPHDRIRGLVPVAPQIVTPAPTTTTTTEPPTTPERDDDLFSMLNNFGSQAMTGPGAGGYCYCSPLSTCPSGSVPRGGNCTNFLSILMNVKYIRCCFRPSQARRMGL